MSPQNNHLTDTPHCAHRYPQEFLRINKGCTMAYYSNTLLQCKNSRFWAEYVGGRKAMFTVVAKANQGMLKERYDDTPTAPEALKNRGTSSLSQRESTAVTVLMN